MKVKRLFSVMGLGLFAAVAAGVGSFALKESKTETVSAAETDYIYLDNSNFYEGNERYAAYFFTKGVGDEWVDFTWDSDIGYNKVEKKSYEKVILCRMNGATAANNWDNKWNQTADLDNQAGIYKPYSKDGQNVGGSWEYPLTVGLTTVHMVPHGSGEVKATVSASANDVVSLKADDDSSAGILNPQSKASNNLTSDNHIKVSGSTTIYVSKSGWSTWSSGYAPSSTKLQDFCDALLALDCDEKDLSSCGWSELNNSEKTDFNSATVTLGTGVSYSTYENVVNEAATRYSLLVSKGATPLTGVTLSVRTGLAIFDNAKGNSVLIITIISVISVSVIGCLTLVVFKRRKHN